ncbi:microcystin dependent MdpB family protein [Litorimonas cladophorae]|uniref:Microcystin dependent MdpB family protein n=1 Tax=Litorimonas cladophorae TaxID=1220491 RepID=A0A918NKF2_9PROT|nr:tail fiber protein [Litorimonas cladophorae]GGX75017.1 microcystin dependent MdpB family protein [Litorimonas cladophorae]
MSEPYLGQITLGGWNFAPRGWAFCHGQLLPISQYSAVFSLLGTTFGGDGRTTFGLPDTRGRCVVGAGRGAGLTDRRIGQRSGAETTTLNVANMPSHSHRVNATNAIGNLTGPGSDFLAKSERTAQKVYHNGPATVQMDAGMIESVGGNTSFNNMQPYLVMNYVIALQGIFPSRS